MCLVRLKLQHLLGLLCFQTLHPVLLFWVAPLNFVAIVATCVAIAAVVSILFASVELAFEYSESKQEVVEVLDFDFDYFAVLAQEVPVSTDADYSTTVESS